MSIIKNLALAGLLSVAAMLTYRVLTAPALPTVTLNPNGTPTPHPTVSVTPVPARIITRTVVPTTTHPTVIPPLDMSAIYALRDWTPPAYHSTYAPPPPPPTPDPCVDASIKLMPECHQ